MSELDGRSPGLPGEVLATQPPGIADDQETPESPELPSYLRGEDVVRDIIELRRTGKEMLVRSAGTGRPELAEWAHHVNRVANNLFGALVECGSDLVDVVNDSEDHTNRAGGRQLPLH